MLKLLTIGALFLSSSAFACPSSVNVKVSVGDLSIDDKTDSDFASFANTHFEMRLDAQPTTDGCLFMSEDIVSEDATSVTRNEIAKKVFLLISSNARGEFIKLDGYTAKNKLYEIRSTKVDVSGNAFAAGFYDASGPAKELLGQAIVNIAAE